jgi:DNA-binding transcriptional LysR family regulator
MTQARNILTPDALAMLQTIANTGSFAAAAREMGMVPSALTYRVRQIEDALDVLLYDRSKHRAKLTQAGMELLQEGGRLLDEIEAMANRVKRIATGWEAQLTISVDTIISRATMLELCERFYSLHPPTRIRLRDECLSGTLETLSAGLADLAIGVSSGASMRDIHTKPLGTVSFVYAVAPQHPLAKLAEPISNETIRNYRAVAVADSTQRGNGLTYGLMGGQDVLTVATMQAKLEAQLRGLGAGNLPLCMAQPYLDKGLLVAKRTQRDKTQAPVQYAWRAGKNQTLGRALQWWLDQLENTVTRAALLNRSGLQTNTTPDATQPAQTPNTK